MLGLAIPFLTCSNPLSVNIAKVEANGLYPDVARPAETSIIFCSEMPNEMVLSGENEWYKGTFSINTQTDPKQLDHLLTDCFINEGIGLTVLAIYKIENNSMTFAGNEPGETSRPDSFVGGRIMVLEKR